MTSEKSVLVYIEDVPYQADKQYEYLLPAALEEVVCVGSLVRCPFGRGSRAVRAVVTEIRTRSEDVKLKEVEDVFSASPVLDEKGLRLCAFMKERYFCPFFEAAKTVMAPGTVGGFDRFVRMDAPVSDPEIRDFFEKNQNTVSRKNLAERLGKENYAKVLRLIKKGELTETLEKKQTVSDSVSRLCACCPAQPITPAANAPKKRRTFKKGLPFSIIFSKTGIRASRTLSI